MTLIITAEGSTIKSISKEYEGDVVLESYYDGSLITAIGSRACESGKLTSIDLRNTKIEVIQNNAFAECTKLLNIYFSETLTTLNQYAFMRAGITELNIPKSLVNFDSAMFNQAPNINNIIVNDENPVFYSKDRCLFRKSNNGLVIASRNITSTKEIPDFDKITAIEAYAFTCCKLKSFIGTPNLVTLGNNAFHVMQKIYLVDLSKTKIEIIPSRAFCACFAHKIILPHTIKTIKNEAFYISPYLTSIILNYPVSSIASDVFKNCPKLRSIYYLGTTDFSTINVFSNDMNPRIYVTDIYEPTHFGCLRVTRKWPRHTRVFQKRSVTFLLSLSVYIMRW